MALKKEQERRMDEQLTAKREKLRSAFNEYTMALGGALVVARIAEDYAVERHLTVCMVQAESAKRVVWVD